MNLYEIIYSNEYKSDTVVKNLEIDNISTSSESIGAKTLFVVIKGINFDANKIIKYVISKSPAAIICNTDLDIESNDIPILKTDNTRSLLPFLYSRFYQIDYSKMKFAAVTGTNGKTTTATMLSHILSSSGRKVGFIGTGKIIIDGKQVNDSEYSMTTPDPSLLYSVIKDMEISGCDTIVMEVSSHALHFDKVLPIPFEIAIFTNLSPEHLDFHKNMDNYYKTKLKLFSQTKKGIFNTDDPYSRKAASEVFCEKNSIGIINSADSFARDVIQNGLSGSEYIFCEPNRLFKVKLCLGGAYNIYNSMLAIKAALELGIKPCDAKKAICNLKSIDGRLETVSKSPTVIIDYAHTEDALLNILKTAYSNKIIGQKITIVFGCGGNRDTQKRPKMAAIAEKYSDFVIVTTDNSRTESETKIIKDILKGFSCPKKHKVISSRKDAIEYAVINADESDIVIVIGKGHERYNIDKNGYHKFDEREIIKNAIDKRKGENLILNEDNTVCTVNAK